MIIEKIDGQLKDTVFVYTTCRDSDEARSLATSAVENHLAVCGDFWAVESVYPWHGALENVEQCMLLLTTQKDLADNLTVFLGNLHSYDVPMFITTETIATSELYKIWLEKTLEENADLLTPEEETKKEEYVAEAGYHPGDYR